MTDEIQHDQDPWASRVKWAFLVFAIIGGFFLLAEHRAHVFPYLPWIFLAACPLMHLFMHGGHRGHSGHGSADRLGAGASGKPASKREAPRGSDGAPNDGSHHLGGGRT